MCGKQIGNNIKRIIILVSSVIVFGQKMNTQVRGRAKERAREGGRGREGQKMNTQVRGRAKGLCAHPPSCLLPSHHLGVQKMNTQARGRAKERGRRGT